MKRLLEAGESSPDGYVRSVARDFHGILRLLHKLKQVTYVGCCWSIKLFYAWAVVLDRV